MSLAENTTPPEDEIGLLLPWYAAGALDAEETRKVEAALARDPVLVERLALTREEMDEAIGFAEAMPAPSPRVRDRVFDRIAAMEEARPLGLADAGRAVQKRVQESGFFGKLMDFVSGFAPRTVAFAGIAAALLIVVQAGFIGTMVSERPAVYGTASGDGPSAAQEGTFAIVSFTPGASMASVGATLTELGATIVEGPRTGGIYRIRIAAKAVANDERDRLIGRLREKRDLIAFAAPSQ